MNEMQNEMQREMSQSELTQLEVCEATISAGLQTFYEVGNALLAVRDARLYRRDFASFEEYCRKRWGMGASRARQLIGAAGVAANLQGVTNVTPANEAQARVLARLVGDAQRAAWQLALWTAPGGSSMTAAHVEIAALSIETLQSWGVALDKITQERALLIDPEFSSILRPHDDIEYRAIEESIRGEFGCLQRLVVWGHTLIDGHLRYRLCLIHDVPFEIFKITFSTRDKAIDFIINQTKWCKHYTPAEASKILHSLPPSIGPKTQAYLEAILSEAEAAQEAGGEMVN
jgi:hypothetical protein